MDKETVIKGCENWVNNHKGENFLLTYSSVVELLALLKEQEAKLPRKITKIGGLMNGICPNILCNAEINSISNEMACGYCGQAVKWNDS